MKLGVLQRGGDEWATLVLARALGAGDLDASAACFARDACLVTQDATAIHGRENIRPLLAQLICRRTQIEVEFSAVLPSGDVALSRERWLIRTDGADGSRFEQTAGPSLVLRRVEGDWRLAIVLLGRWGSRR